MSGLQLLAFFAVALALLALAFMAEEREWRPVRRVLCAVGFHGRPIGLIDWLTPYSPKTERIDYRNFVGCPYCRREVRS